MLIVCTKDPTIVATALNPVSGSGQWAAVVVLNAAFTQAQATNAIAQNLALLGPAEPLCFSAHGNDTDIGDAGSGPNDWGWSRQQIATLLQQNAPAGYS